MSYSELHFHILPGVDDGPRTMHEAVELAGLAAAEGTRTITATPHVMDGIVTDPTTLPPRVEAVNRALREAQVPVEVLCGGELAHPMALTLSPAELDVIAHGPAGRRWLLLEAPLTGPTRSFTRAADRLRGLGFGILVAHPERSLAAKPGEWAIIESEISQGSAMQVNAWSLAGVNGEEARAQAVRIVRCAPVVVVASDAHRVERPPALAMGMEALRELGISRPEWFVGITPKALLDRGLPLSAAAQAA